MPKSSSTRKTSLLKLMGLHRPELRAWAMYDWAISSVQTTIMVAVFPLFFLKVPAAGLSGVQALLAWNRINLVGAVIIAIIAPVLGAIADYRASKKRYLIAFMLVGVTASASMFFISRGQLLGASIVFVISMVAASGSMTFYESLLPHIASRKELSRVSTAGYAVGYVGSGLLLALNLAWISKPELFGLPSGDGLTHSFLDCLPAESGQGTASSWALLSTC